MGDDRAPVAIVQITIIAAHLVPDRDEARGRGGVGAGWGSAGCGERDERADYARQQCHEHADEGGTRPGRWLPESCDQIRAGSVTPDADRPRLSRAHARRPRPHQFRQSEVQRREHGRVGDRRASGWRAARARDGGDAL